MNLRIGTMAVLVIVALTACSSNIGGTGAPPTTSARTASQTSAGTASQSSAPTASAIDSSAPPVGNLDYCAKLKEFSTRISGFGAGAGNPSTLAATFDAEIGFLKGLQPGAPANISSALSDIISALAAAKVTLSDPAHADAGALQNLASRLPADSQAIGAYIVKNCIGAPTDQPS